MSRRERARRDRRAASAAATATPRRTPAATVLRLTDMRPRARRSTSQKGRCTVEAGVSLDALMRVLHPARLVPVVVPGHALRHRRRRHRLRHPRQVPADGTFATTSSAMQLRHAGARRASTVGPDADPDVFWATAGGMGLTGVVTEATLRLLPVETAYMSVDTERVPRPRRLHGAHARRRRPTTATRSRGSTASRAGRDLGRSVLTRGDHATARRAPPNAARRRARASRRVTLATRAAVGAERAAQPALDPRVQRAVVPQGAARATRPDPERSPRSSTRSTACAAGTASTAGAASCSTSSSSRTAPRPSSAPRSSGSARPAARRSSRCSSASGTRARGLLGFPMPGWTLALDIPARGAELGELLDGLDELVADAGGRVYLAKDSRLAPELLPGDVPATSTAGARSAAGSTRARRCAATSTAGSASPAASEGQRCMKDALGSVQSVLVLGGGSDIALATCAALVPRRRARVVLAARKPEDARRRPSPRSCAAGAVRRRRRSPFDATDFATHQQFVDVDVRPLRRLRRRARRVRRARRPGRGRDRRRGRASRSSQTNFTGVVSVTVPARAAAASSRATARSWCCRSVAGERARRSNFVYGSSKAGLDAFFQGLGDALAGTRRAGHDRAARLRAHEDDRGLEPAPLSTTPEAVAQAIVRGLERGRETVWVPPTLRYVMSGLRHLPRPVFRRLKI